MKPTRFAAAGYAAAALLVAGGAALAVRPSTAPVLELPAAEIRRLSGSIAFFEQQFGRDAENTLAGGHLVNRYLLRFQLAADLRDVQRAEGVSRALLAVAPDRAGAHARLAGVLLMQHRFGEALDAAEQAVAADSTHEAALAALFDAGMAAGRYARAENALRRLDPASTTRRVRLATWLEANGKPDDAARTLSGVCRDMEEGGIPAQTVAWCLTELAGLQPDDAAAASVLRRALAVQPGYRGAVEGLADLALSQNQWKQAAALYGPIAADAHPDLFLRLAESHAGMGDTARAAHWEREFLRVAAAPGAEALHAHELARFYARSAETHDAALAVAQRDVARRPSVQSWDVLSRVHFARGELRDALAASDRARGWGVPTAEMDQHRSAILRTLKPERARSAPEVAAEPVRG